MTWQSRQRGNGTLLGLGLIGLAVGLIGLGLLIHAWVAVQHRAESVADLTALAVAGQAAAGSDQVDACAAGALLAEQNSGRLEDCDVVRAADEVAVRVAVSLPLSRPLPGLPSAASATSYAGNPSAQAGP